MKNLAFCISAVWWTIIISETVQAMRQININSNGKLYSQSEWYYLWAYTSYNKRVREIRVACCDIAESAELLDLLIY